MADIIFEHTLPDETYNNSGHPFDGKNKRILYAMGMYYATRAPRDPDFDTVEEFATWVVNNLDAAKERYEEEMNKVVKRQISRGLNMFLNAKIDHSVPEIDVTTEEQ